MSLALHPASRKVRVSDPRLDFDNQGIEIISDSATGLIYQKFTAAQPTGNIITFNTFQQPTNAVSTKMYIRTIFTVVINSGADNTAGYIQDAMAPRQFPLHSVAQNARIQINGASNDIYPNQIIHALMKYNNTLSEMGRDLSPAISFPDMFQSYNDDVANGGAGAVAGNFNPTPAGLSAYGTALNAFGMYGEGSYSIQARGSTVLSIAYSGVGGRIATITFESFEPVVLSPLIWSHDEHKSLINVNTLNITYNLGDIRRVWSIKQSLLTAGYSITSAAISGNPELYMIQMQPKITNKINKTQIYPWHQIVPFQQTLTFPARGAAVAPSLSNLTKLTVPFNALQLSGVPKRIYIYAKRADETPSTTDTFCGIEDIVVTFDTVAGIFGGAPKQQLYQVSVKNGYQGSYEQWAHYQGSVFCFSPEDIPLGELLSTGSSKNITFSYQVTLSRLDTPFGVQAAANFILYTMVVYDGVFFIDERGAPGFQINTISPGDLLDSSPVMKLPYHAIKGFATGGSFSSSLSNIGDYAKKLGRKAIGAYEALPESTRHGIQDIVTDAATFISPALGKAVSDFGPDAYEKAKQLLGMGYSENQIYALLAGAGMKQKTVKGGKKLTKAQLKKLVEG